MVKKLTMPRPMMVRVPDLVLMHPQNVFITDILQYFLSSQPAARIKLKTSVVDILDKQGTPTSSTVQCFVAP